MAASAVEAEFAVVHVVGTVTIAAALAELRMCAQGLPMAMVAGHRGVRTQQREICLRIVIEAPLLPVDGVVTGGAVVVEATFVGIVVPMAVDAGGRRIAEDLRPVAVLALGLCVRTQQREPGQPMIEEDVLLPVGLVVALLAGGALRAFVRVVVFVAIVAAGVERHFIDRLDVTGLAFDGLVGAVQGVVRVGVVIEDDVVPGVAGVAALAGSPEMTLVLVVVLVAGDAGDLELIGKGILAVTIAAGQVRVFTVEREAGIARVVEERVFPSGRTVAIAALLAALAVVRIVFRVAAVTGHRRLLECLVGVTVQAGRLQMFADEWIARVVVIECHVFPAGRRMAVAAGRAEGTLVDVVVGMAVRAFVRGFTVLCARFVTRIAPGFLVFAQQQVVCQRVIERIPVQVHDIRVAPLVVGMAGLTGFFTRLVGQPVKSHTHVYVPGDLVVTIEAQHALLPPFELLMAFIAVLLDIRMARDDLTRHDQGLDLRVSRGVDQK